MRCRSEVLLISPPVTGGRKRDSRFKLNVAVFYPGVETGDGVALIFHAQPVAQAKALLFQRTGNPQVAVMLGDNSATVRWR